MAGAAGGVGGATAAAHGTGVSAVAAVLAAVLAGQPVLATSFAEWRAAARALLAHGVAPHAVAWIEHQDDGDLFAGAAPAPPASSQSMQPSLPASPGADTPSGPTGSASGDMFADTTNAVAAPRAPVLRVPRQLMETLQSAACFRAPDRWAFLYRVLWRWQRGEQAVASPADGDGARLYTMAKAVRREEHDMHAYLRFRERPEAAGAPHFVAWFEPAHDVLPQVARHFAARMGRTSWMIATPDSTVLWDGVSMHATGPLMSGPADIDDAGEALWLTYYRSIFNPARLNVQVMQSHIPSRFWKNLPEGSEVPQMVSQAATGARCTGQAQGVGQRVGTVVRMTAEGAQPLREASNQLDQCRRCDLWQKATQAVGGEGPAQAPIMLVGEQPGDQEDLAGKPFVGPAGQVLERALAEAQLDRASVYVTNAVKHFKWEPRGKRRLHKTPAQREIAACQHWLEQELAAVGPQVVVALGSTALKAVTGDSSAALKDLLGQPFRHQGRWVVAVYHPSYVLRAPDEQTKKMAFDVMVEGLRQARSLPAP